MTPLPFPTKTTTRQDTTTLLSHRKKKLKENNHSSWEWEWKNGNKNPRTVGQRENKVAFHKKSIAERNIAILGTPSWCVPLNFPLKQFHRPVYILPLWMLMYFTTGGHVFPCSFCCIFCCDYSMYISWKLCMGNFFFFFCFLSFFFRASARMGWIFFRFCFMLLLFSDDVMFTSFREVRFMCPALSMVVSNRYQKGS